MASERAKKVVSMSAAVVLGCAAMSACAPGHGAYTSAFKERAERNMNMVKAGTGWDMARQRFLAGDLGKALKGVDESIALAPDVSKSHRLRGRVLFEMGRLEDALAAFERASELDAEDAKPHYFRGVIFERWSRFERALAAFEAAAAKDPSDPQHVVASAEMLMQLGRLDEAGEVLARAGGRFEHNAGVRQTLGHLAMMRGEISAAVEAFEAACLLAPGEAGLLEDLARAQAAAGRFSEAEGSLERVLRRSGEGGGDRRDLMHLRARCLMELDRPVEAMRLYEALVGGDGGGSDAEAWVGLGRSALVVGSERRALGAGARLVEMAPSRAEGWALRAAALRASGELEAAASSLSGAESLTVGGAEVLALRASILAELGRAGEAAASARAALERAPGLRAARAVRAWTERGGVQDGAVVNVRVSPDG